MAIKLGKNPETFKKPLKLIGSDDVVETLVIEFKYRTRLELATLTDERNARSKAEVERKRLDSETAPALPDGVEPKQETIAKIVMEAIQGAAADVLEVAKAWDLPDEFNVENLAILEGMYPGVLAQIQELYQASVLEPRQKN